MGTDITVKSVTVQNPGNSNLIRDELLMPDKDYTYNSTSVTMLAISENVSILQSSDGTVKVTYVINNGEIKDLKEMWGDLSSRSPTMGYWQNDNGTKSCGNSEKGYCHAVIESFAYDLIDEIKENRLGIYYSHDVAYTSTEYSAKQVKLCAVCHFNKLPPMNSDGVPIHQNGYAQQSSWAHKQVQCIKCHSHAGIDDQYSM